MKHSILGTLLGLAAVVFMFIVLVAAFADRWHALLHALSAN